MSPAECMHRGTRIMAGGVQDTVDAESAVDQLQAAGISTSVTGIASTRLDFEARRLPDSMIRASVHYCNSEQVH